MFFTLTVVVFATAIIVCFSKEFSNLLKSLFEIRGMKLFLPLVIATVMVIYFEPWILWSLVYFKLGLHLIVSQLVEIFPFSGAYYLAGLLLIMLVTLIPILTVYFWKKKRPFLSFEYSWIVNLMVWLVMVVLFSISL